MKNATAFPSYLQVQNLEREIVWYSENSDLFYQLHSSEWPSPWTWSPWKILPAEIEYLRGICTGSQSLTMELLIGCSDAYMPVPTATDVYKTQWGTSNHCWLLLSMMGLAVLAHIYHLILWDLLRFQLVSLSMIKGERSTSIQYLCSHGVSRKYWFAVRQRTLSETLDLFWIWIMGWTALLPVHPYWRWAFQRKWYLTAVKTSCKIDALIV